MNFSRFLDIQSWWEVPSIAYFCSLFRTAFNLLDFDIEELEEALLTDGSEESGNSLLTELIVRLLKGCLGNNEISAFNYQMYLRRLFRRKCQETKRKNPFDSDIDFQFLPLRTKVEILYALCDYRLDAEDVFDLFKNLEAESLRVEPLGWDDNDCAYWYFYGTRLYREDIIRKPKGKSKKRRGSRKRGWFYGDDWLYDVHTERVWQVVCFTAEDWRHLTAKFKRATSKVERELYRSLSENFLPEIPRLFQEKEKLQRKRLLELAPRRTSSRVLQKIKQKEEEENKQGSQSSSKDDEDSKPPAELARESRAKRRSLLRRPKSIPKPSDTSDSSSSEPEAMPQKISKPSKRHDKKRSKNSSATKKGEPPPEPPVKSGRKTNNSLACATGQIVIPDTDEPVSSTRKKLKTSQIFSQTDEDIRTDMYKVLEQLIAHDDAWPFMDPVEEKYAPNYYAVIRRPMDLHKMEERLDTGYYTDFSMFKADFKLIVNNCRLYNGQDNEYTLMVDNLQAAFDRLTEKYMHRLSSSDEEIAVEYQIPTPSRKHKLKRSESPIIHKKKKKSHSDDPEPQSSSSGTKPVQEPKLEQEPDNDEEMEPKVESKKSKQSHKSKGKKKRKGHHKHGKHSKSRKKSSHKSGGTSSKIKHSKKHTKSKTKIKKKKSKHHEDEPKPEETLKRSESQESIESSNRSRSASPLPSIRTLTPSPEPDEQPPSDQLTDPDFFKDKYDKIKERRRHAAKDAWDSLFDHKQKQSLHLPERDKNPKLRETIEKLRAKNEKYKDNSSIFNSLLKSGNSSNDVTDSNSKEPSVVPNSHNSSDESDDDEVNPKKKKLTKKVAKKSTVKNEIATEALEQAVKDITKWLGDAPKGSPGSSPCDSPTQTISTEDQDNSRVDDEFYQAEKSAAPRKETRKRQLSREPKLAKRREIQRTIDRLQPGKSKGNLLTNLSNKNSEKLDEAIPLGPLTKTRDIEKGEEMSPKLSLGSVLPTVKFTLGNDHNFIDDEKKSDKDTKALKDTDNSSKADKENDDKPEEKPAQPDKKDAEVETEPMTPTKLSQEKATPNLSAWFKAFGAPKSTGPSSSTKKKPDDTELEEKLPDALTNEKQASPKNTGKYDSPNDPATPNTDGGDSPLPNASATPRHRKTSTGSSMSERSSFSQDLDSPRHQMSHTSPLLRSPASPRTEEFQKITYPIINGTVRAGFYQDTTSIKSSPEKSCSPRDGPQSPYSPYSQHVYASNSVMGSSTPNYFVDHNRSPLSSTYSHNPPGYYEASRVSVNNRSTRVNEEFPNIVSDTYPQTSYTSQFSPAQPAYIQSSNYSQAQVSPQSTNNTPPIINVQAAQDPKNSVFPVKKRTYNDPDQSQLTIKKIHDPKEFSTSISTKNEYHQKVTQSLHSMSSMCTSSVDNIALALGEKSEMAKLNSIREKSNNDITDRHGVENRDRTMFGNNQALNEPKKDGGIDINLSFGTMKKDNVDMVNMGYMNPDDRRNMIDAHDAAYSISRDMSKSSFSTKPKPYDVDNMAINLGMNNPHIQKAISKSSSNIPPAHTHERTHHEILSHENLVHAHQYEPISGHKFSLNDIELANKKLFTSVSTASALDYGNWKMPSHMRKQDLLPTDYTSVYNVNNVDKLKSDMNLTTTSAINYNKNLQQQYANYNASRASAQRSQEISQQNLNSELRIPNPRGLIKNDHLSSVQSLNESDLIGKSQKNEKFAQNHPSVSSIPYKVPYSTHSSLPLDTLRSLPNIPQILDRYSSEDRYMAGFGGTTPTLYHDKAFQMFGKNTGADDHNASTTSSMYSQSANTSSKDMYKSATVTTSQVDAKAKAKRKRTEAKPMQVSASQSYHVATSSADVLSSVKTSMMPGSAFNFGAATNISLGSGLYGDNAGFSIEDFRNSNQIMAANYMAAAVAHQQRSNADANADKFVKPAHQNSSHASSSFPFIGSQVRAGYPFVSADPSSPLYQPYLQRHQAEEILRQTGAQIMGLYPPGYPSLGVRQPYDSINRPSWL